MHYPNAEANGLLTKWKEYAPAIMNVLKMDKVIVSTGWNEEVERFIALIKLLPAKTGKAPAIPFINVVNRLMIHTEVSSQNQFVLIFTLLYHNYYHCHICIEGFQFNRNERNYQK